MSRLNVLARSLPAAAVLATTLLGLPALAQDAPQGQPQMNLARTELSAGMHRIHAQVAKKPARSASSFRFGRLP